VFAFFARLKWCVQESLPPMKAGQPAVAVTLIEVLFVVEPLVPVIVIGNVLAGTEQARAMVRPDGAEPPEGTLTLVGLKVTVTPAGTLESVRATEPENDLILVTVIVDAPDVPVAIVREDGVAVRLKLLGGGMLTVIVFDAGLVLPL
jgi:hypothetical protein